MTFCKAFNNIPDFENLGYQVKIVNLSFESTMILPSLESWHTEFGNSLILLLVKFNIVRVEESWPEQNPLNIWNTTVCSFYVDKSICSFDPLQIPSDYSNKSKIHCLVRTFDKNTLRILWKIFFRHFSLFYQKWYISQFKYNCAKHIDI